jgi:hypothetical protein
MREEANVPIAERWLLLEGAASPKALEAVRAGLPESWPDTVRCIFVSYAFADLPLGKRFDFVFPRGKPAAREPTIAIIHAVTQQFAKPFDEIPHGWKTICLIDFPGGPPRLIEQLRTADSWFETNEPVGLCGRETMEARLKGNG